MTEPQLPFPALAKAVIEDLANGLCVQITGLSNTGKSTFMRALASPIAEDAYQETRNNSGFLIYIDCNRAVEISAQAFYEVVLRAILESIPARISEELVSTLRSHHQSVTEANSAFSASLSFNLALTDLCEQLDSDLCLLIDEFDEIYTALDDRALLNLRALRDRFQQRLRYITATVRQLPKLRGREFADEFAELFTHAVHGLPKLTVDEGTHLLEGLQLPYLKEERVRLSLELSGGHPGLLIAVAQVMGNINTDHEEKLRDLVSREPQPIAECLKIWNQLSEVEQEQVASMVLEAEAGIPELQKKRLRKAGVVLDSELFSPLFSGFVARRSRGAHISEVGVHLDVDSGDVWVDGVRIPVLTDLEFRLLKLLYERLDKLTDKYRIVTAVWGEAYLGDVDDARVEKLISRLRSKIESDPANPRYLVTLRGRGYKLLSKPRA